MCVCVKRKRGIDVVYIYVDTSELRPYQDIQNQILGCKMRIEWKNETTGKKIGKFELGGSKELSWP